MKNSSKYKLLQRLERLGIDAIDANKLLRIQTTLHKWAEAECNGEIQRDDDTQKPRRYFGMNGPGPITSTPIPDSEGNALRRLREIMARYPSLWWYHQTDPRGCMLYVGAWADLGPVPAFEDPETARVREILDQRYTNGVAVCL